MTARIALVVPSIEDCGGVISVAEFVRRTIGKRSDLDLRLISLAMASTDSCSVRLLDPTSWLSGVRVREGQFAGERFVHVGAFLSEIEVQRFKPRAVLRSLVEDCDLIQVVAGAPSWALPVCGLGIPVALQVATLTSVERRKAGAAHRGALAAWRRAMTRRVAQLDEKALRAVDAILVENTWMLDYATAACSGLSTLVRYAPPGVDVDMFKPMPQRKPCEGYILTVGRMSDPRKNAMLLIEAYGNLCRTMQAAPRLVLAGPDGPPQAFWRHADDLGIAGQIDVRIFPTMDELAVLYREAQSFVLASDEEGFGIVIIEAMASGVPAVSTRSGGPEGIISDGKDGFVVDRDDAIVLAERLHRLATDESLNRRMGQRARATVETRYSESVAAQAYLGIYDELLARRSRDGLSSKYEVSGRCAV